MIKDFSPRLYQEAIFATAAQKNTLVVLPTGMGKTNIFLMMAGHRLNTYPGTKILLIGPTKPLIDQYLDVFKKHFEINEEKMCVLTGEVSPAKRAGLFEKSTLIFSTPQGLQNDLITKKINLENVSLLGVDEAHRATGEYSYVWIAQQYNKNANHPRIIAMTASPGTDTDSIKEICSNLFIEEIESRNYEDEDVMQYIQPIEITWEEVELGNELEEVRKLLGKCMNARAEKLRKNDLTISGNSKGDLLKLQGKLQGRIAAGEKDHLMWSSISLLAECIKIQHAQELVETQGLGQLVKYFEKLEGEERKSKAAKSLESDYEFKTASLKAKILHEKGVEHPKMIRLGQILEREKTNPDSKLMIFTQYRDSGSIIVEKCKKIGVATRLFVGQEKKSGTGMSQKEQKEMLDEFRDGKFSVLVATSIGEEGLDIPKVDTVIFYEPIPSAIRHIQRRGRTGRQEKGRVIVLLTKGTRDEAFRWIAARKEKKMNLSISKLKGNLGESQTVKQATRLEKFMKPKIYADSREQGNQTLKLLSESADIIMQRLDSADYVVSPRCGIEIKNTKDFVDSIIDGRLLAQLKELKVAFERPLIIIEGSGDIYSMRNISPNAIRGMLATIAVSYAIPILTSKNSEETAGLILAVARKEQEQAAEFSPHKSKPATLKDKQEYVVSSLPNIGLALARPLLKEFKTVKNVVNASEDDLKKVEKIGEKKASEIRKVLDSEYEEK